MYVLFFVLYDWWGEEGRGMMISGDKKKIFYFLSCGGSHAPVCILVLYVCVVLCRFGFFNSSSNWLLLYTKCFGESLLVV